MLPWDDLRFLLAAERSGSLSRAARELGVSLSTISRRLRTLEEAIGRPLFVRTPSGLEPTSAALALVVSAGLSAPGSAATASQTSRPSSAQR